MRAPACAGRTGQSTRAIASSVTLAHGLRDPTYDLARRAAYERFGQLNDQACAPLPDSRNQNRQEIPTMTFKLPDLPYAYDALAPYMSKETLEFHHDKHHLAYVDNGNKFAGPGTKYEGKSIEDICKEAFAAKDAPVINNIGQHYNHIHFWKWMKKGGGGKKLPAKLQKLVDEIGGYDKVRSDFIAAGVGQFGSGWAWLAVKGGKLEVQKTPNGENPLMHGAKPILGVDVWEHSYYIDYRNARPKYLEAWFDNLVNWEYVEEMLG
jgi:superoxide dismutase, Fe-Mn family